MTRVVKTGLIAVLLFYFLGVVGFAAAEVWRAWDGDWSFSMDVRDTLEGALAWPLLFTQRI